MYKLREALSDKDKQKLRRMKKKDNMTWRDWLDVMGTNRQRYKRVRGAIRWHYDKTRRTIYAIDEIYGVKLSNREVAEKIKAKNYHVEPIIADSAEPKSVDEMKKEHGIPRIKGAKKGPGSVEYGEKMSRSTQTAKNASP